MSVDFFEDGNPSSSKKTKKSSTTPVLDNFSRDLNKLAEEGKIDPVVGREKEVKRIAQILARKKKNNAIIVGDAGVGKSALVEKLALMIYKGECPTNLLDKRVMSLDLTSLVAGTKYRGQFEERIKIALKIIEPIITNLGPRFFSSRAEIIAPESDPTAKILPSAPYSAAPLSNT